MRNFVALTRRELLSVYVSPLAYGAAAVFMFLFGAFFVVQFARLKLVEVTAVVEPLGHILPALVAPVLTMRLLAEERRMGTLEMLMTAPVGDLEVVLAKFFGVWIFYASMVALTAAHVGAMLWFYDGSVDWGGFAAGYLGMLLMAGLFLAYGLFVSSLFESPILAALIAFVSGLLVLMAGFLISSPVLVKPGLQQDILNFLMPFKHYATFLQGVVDTRDLVYFAASIAYLLFLTTKVVESRKWR
ncbi:MAG: ABC transporter permease [Planctomycetota bacterium]|nr:ABC transporter permease [Planctomycetota bacterium]